MTFTGLDEDTDYYVFARAKENTSYAAGGWKVSEAITTDKTPLTNPDPTPDPENPAENPDTGSGDMMMLVWMGGAALLGGTVLSRRKKEK